MKILLLSIHEEFDVKLSRNIGVHRIAQYLRKNNVLCDICEIGIDDHTSFLQKTLNGEYSIIGVSSTYFFLEKELEIIAPFYKAKERYQCLFIAGGNSPSQDDELWLNLGFDAVIRGYGEFSMLALIKELEKSSFNILNAFSSVNGISYIKSNYSPHQFKHY